MLGGERGRDALIDPRGQQGELRLSCRLLGDTRAQVATIADRAHSARYEGLRRLSTGGRHHAAVSGAIILFFISLSG